MDQKQKAIVAGVNLRKQDADFRHSMEELKGLAEACHLEVVGEVTQNLTNIHPAYYIGKGKIDELINLIDRTEAEQIIFNDELTPSQIRVLEDQFGLPVIDRTMLILAIFADRAQTREAQLQVEVARLEYMLPRLVGQRAYLSRQGGRAGLVNRGAGETKLELDRRSIENKIAVLNKELEALAAQRQTQRKQRRKSGLPLVSLVGYTNAGKSTLMNAFVDHFQASAKKFVLEKDMLFATLDTSVRKISLADNKTFLLTDTVGFISQLPHHLVKAFRSTLEEVVQADLLIHVVDYSDPRHQKLMEVTNQTLADIGVKDTPVIYAFNKADLTEIEVPQVFHDTVYLSAKRKTGISELARLIAKHVFRDYLQCELLIPYDQGHIVAYFNKYAHVLGTDYGPDGTKLTVECRRHDFERYKQYAFVSERQ